MHTKERVEHDTVVFVKHCVYPYESGVDAYSFTEFKGKLLKYAVSGCGKTCLDLSIDGENIGRDYFERGLTCKDINWPVKKNAGVYVTNIDKQPMDITVTFLIEKDIQND